MHAKGLGSSLAHTLALARLGSAPLRSAPESLGACLAASMRAKGLGSSRGLTQLRTGSAQLRSAALSFFTSNELPRALLTAKEIPPLKCALTRPCKRRAA